jgi:hypothetical protein
MKTAVIAMLVLQALAHGKSWGFHSAHAHYHPYVFNQNALPFNPQFWAKEPVQGLPPAPVDPNDKCQDPHFKDAPFCQKTVFTRAGEAIPIFWKSRNIALGPINNAVGGAVQLRTYDSADKNQKWILTAVREHGNLYYITNAESKLALTANAYPSHLILQNNIKAENQRFYVSPQTDGSFFLSTYGTNLYWDAQEVDSGSLPILVIRNYEGDATQKWLLN